MQTRFIDMHCDTMDVIARSNGAIGLRDGSTHINLEKMRKGNAFVQFFAMYIRTHDRLSAAGLTTPPYDYFYFCYDAYQRELAANADLIAPAFSCADIQRNWGQGLMSAVLSIEDSVSLEGKLERVDEFYQKGVRMMSLTWNYENSLAYPQSEAPEKMCLGLKPFGIEAVRRMEELGIMVDVSHLSDGGFYDVAKYVKGPFVASHSCARALSQSPRCLTDEMLRILADHGGVCGINFYSEFLHVLDERGDYTPIDDIVRHARHIANVAGVDSVALGSDFDGVGSKMEFEDYAGMPLIADALSRVFTADEVDKICWGNTLRVMQDVIG